MELYDLEGQQIRRKQVYKLAIEHLLNYFDGNGKWIKEGWKPGLRERLWLCFPLLKSQDENIIRRGNIIIRESVFVFCHFSPMICLQLLTNYKEALEEESIKILHRYLKDTLQSFKGDDLDFAGVNDNFACMSTYTALIGGEIFKDKELYEVGKRRLEQLKSLLIRRGVTTEYTSPTYTPIQVYVIAEIYNSVGDEAIRQIALQCEERLWIDILGHYHTTTFQIAGPYSRAYTVDSAGHTHQARFILYALMGNNVLVNPINTLFAPSEERKGGVIHLNIAFMQISVAWLMSIDYHCPTYLVEWALNRTYPYEFEATTEYSSSTDALTNEEKRNPNVEDELYEYAGGSGSISTYMTEDYALGIASNEFHNGIQTDAFHILYRHCVPVNSQKDIATVYCRYLINEKKVGGKNYYPQFNIESDDNSLWDEGRKIGIQHKNTAMMIYKPKIYGHTDVTSLKLSLILSNHDGSMDEIWLGENKLENFQGESIQPCSIFIKHGPVYMAFHPLLLTNCGREAAVKVESINNHLVISLYNYEGNRQDFAKRAFLLIGNGFIAEVSEEKESGTFENFRKKMKDILIKDSLSTSVHRRQTYLRAITYSREGVTIECEYSPVSEGIKYISVNGKVQEHKRLSATGLDTNKFLLK